MALPSSSRISPAFRVLSLAVVALILFALTASPFVLVFAAFREVPFVEPMNLYGGIVCSLIAWLFVLIFHVRREKLSLPYSDQRAFIQKLREELAELGYELSQSAPDSLEGKPSFTALLFGGNIQVKLLKKSATLSGPKISLESLRSRLRVQSHVDSNRRTLEDSGFYLEQGLLRGVQIHFPVSGNDQHEAARQFIEDLKRMGATVHCDVTIWAQSETGIEGLVVEKLVRDKIKQKGIPVTVRKKPLLPADADPAGLLG
jgi:hypothetical protein